MSHPALKILMVGNYEPDRQYSMQGFADALRSGLCKRGVEVHLLKPPPRFGKAGGKWTGYADKFALFLPELRRAAKRVDVVHVCDQGNALYLHALQNVPHVITCHDLLAIRSAHGELEGWPTGRSGRILQRLILSGLNRAQFVVCDSEATRADLLRISRLPPARTEQSYMSLLRPASRWSLSESAASLEDVALPDGPFLLHVGGNQFYKNRAGVVEIFQQLRAHAGFESLSLVLAGKPLVAKMRTSDVCEVANPTDVQIQALYSRAEALLFPSFYEGFGLPIIEAQACGCPVFTSNRAPMTEVGGDAAVYVDPASPTDAAQTIAEHWNKRPAMVQAGFENIKRFTTERMIDEYLEVYRRVLSQ